MKDTMSRPVTPAACNKLAHTPCKAGCQAALCCTCKHNRLAPYNGLQHDKNSTLLNKQIVEGQLRTMNIGSWGMETSREPLCTNPGTFCLQKPRELLKYRCMLVRQKPPVGLIVHIHVVQS